MAWSGAGDPRIGVLGSIEAMVGERVVALGSRQQQALLAVLAMRPNTVVSIDALIDAIWDDKAPRTVRNVIQIYVARLRKVLGTAVLQTVSPGYLLALDPERIDVTRFEALLKESTTAALREAIGLWRGDALAGLPSTPVLDAERARLRAMRRAATHELIEHDIASGGAPALLGDLERMLQDDPLDERTWMHYVRALYADGRPADALAAQRRAVATIRAELGVDPTPGLAQLESAVLNHRLPTGGAAVEKTFVPRELPTPRTSFVGRSAELEQLDAMLAVERLVTVTGPGGAGKTRLAIEAARSGSPVERRRSAGVRMVDLVPARDPAAAVATVFGVTRPPGLSWTEALVEYLRDIRSLIVLDNCEHLTSSVAALVGALLDHCPGLHILATSREPLAVPGERVVSLRPLSEPEAVRLFLDRAPVAITSTEGNEAAVAEICRQLDCLPLAIELAASRTATMSVVDLASRLRPLREVLGPGPRSVPSRQRTVHGLIKWSYDLLTGREKRLFTRLSVFVDSFSLDAAEAFDTAEVVQSLVEKSLVERVDDGAGRSRYRLLMTLREFAHDHLRDVGLAPRDQYLRHARHYASWLARSAPPLFARTVLSSSSVEWLAALDGERANLTVAIRRSLDAGDGAMAADLLHDAALLWAVRGPINEGRDFVERALAIAPDARAQMRMSFWMMSFAQQQGDFDRADRARTVAVALAEELGDEGTFAGLCMHQGITDSARGNFGAARRWLEEGASAARSVGADDLVAGGMIQLARIDCEEGDLASARTKLDTALTLTEPLGPSFLVASALFFMATIARIQGNAAASALAGKSLTEYRRVGSEEGIAAAMRIVGQCEPDPHRAVGIFLERLEILRRLGSQGGIATCLEDLADVLATLGLDPDAARLLTAATGLRERIGAPVPPSDRRARLRLEVDLRARIGESAYRDVAAGWRTMTPAAAATHVRMRVGSASAGIPEQQPAPTA